MVHEIAVVASHMYILSYGLILLQIIITDICIVIYL
jgi:hypothetical protein